MPQRILVVEDNDGLRFALSCELEAAGYEVSQAHDYQGALDVLDSGRRFTLLIVDLVLPGVNGFALARMARVRQRTLKVLYMTGFENVPMSEANGPVLFKPIAPEVLLATISNLTRAESKSV